MRARRVYQQTRAGLLRVGSEVATGREAQTGEAQTGEALADAERFCKKNFQKVSSRRLRIHLLGNKQVKG
jgi:hypothetical protein